MRPARDPWSTSTGTGRKSGPRVKPFTARDRASAVHRPRLLFLLRLLRLLDDVDGDYHVGRDDPDLAREFRVGRIELHADAVVRADRRIPAEDTVGDERFVPGLHRRDPVPGALRE